MKVAALYDVHGMSWALEAVLAEAAAAERRRHRCSAAIWSRAPIRVEPSSSRALDGDCFVRGNCEREPDEWVAEQLTRTTTCAWLAELPMTVDVRRGSLLPLDAGGRPPITR